MTLDDLQTSTSATLTVTATGEILGLDPRTVMRGVEDGTIPAIRIGRRVVIPRLPLLKMLTGDEQTVAA